MEEDSDSPLSSVPTNLSDLSDPELELEPGPKIHDEIVVTTRSRRASAASPAKKQKIAKAATGDSKGDDKAKDKDVTTAWKERKRAALEESRNKEMARLRRRAMKKAEDIRKAVR
jgi:hypothetical protein